MRYSREDGCRAWLTYPVLSPQLLMELLDEYGSAEQIYQTFRGTKGAFLKGRITEQKIAVLLEQSAPDRMHEMMQTMNKSEMRIIGMDAPEYPDILRNINDPPVFLFCIGNVQALSGRCFTMVGTRKPSVKGEQAAEKIAHVLSDNSITIVSGLAQGIDSASHRGCMMGQSPTIAVCGTGLDINYPAENDQLRSSILEKGGLLLSEFAPGTPALRYNFGYRNRIISGLSRGTMMVECKIKSGSMLTVQHALDQGREVFAWPGEPGSEWSEGAHQLIREGARYATGAEDILEDMGWENLASADPKDSSPPPPLTPEQHKIMTALHQGEKSLDELAAETGLDISVLSISLTMLQLMNLIHPLPGKMYEII